MNEKDIAQKTLFGYNDVFADIVNVLLFNGEQVIEANSLTDSQTFSQYKAKGEKLHEQERGSYILLTNSSHCNVNASICSCNSA